MKILILNNFCVIFNFMLYMFYDLYFMYTSININIKYYYMMNGKITNISNIGV